MFVYPPRSVLLCCWPPIDGAPGTTAIPVAHLVNGAKNAQPILLSFSFYCSLHTHLCGLRWLQLIRSTHLFQLNEPCFVRLVVVWGRSWIHKMMDDFAGSSLG